MAAYSREQTCRYERRGVLAGANGWFPAVAADAKRIFFQKGREPERIFEISSEEPFRERGVQEMPRS